MEINLSKLLDTAHQLRQAEHQALEQGKLGSYRAGNTGIYLNAQFYGNKCPRKTLLRNLGIDTEDTEASKHIMFSGGRMNEEVWMESLRLAYEWDILQEEEIPTSWKTDEGTVVSGRPDIVLLNRDKKPVLGIELKMASSVWTTRDVLFLDMPKFDHLAQAAHYMWQLKIPFKLAYTGYVEYPVVGWMQKNFPKKGAKGSEHCEYNEKGDIKKTRPFNRIYDLRFDQLTGILQYSIEGTNTWITTVISTEGIQNYFNELDNCQKKNKLPSRPMTVNPDGAKDGWSICSYCSLAATCDKTDNGSLSNWKKEVVQLMTATESGNGSLTINSPSSTEGN